MKKLPPCIISFRNISSAFTNNVKPREKDIKEIIKVSPRYSRSLALQAIKHNRKIPKKLLESMKRKRYRMSYIHVNNLTDTYYNCTNEFKIFYTILKKVYTDQLVNILKRNPELLEVFV